MSNTVSSSWDKGNSPVAGSGTAAKGYPTIVMQWNQPSDDSNNDEIVSPLLDMPLTGTVTILVNTEAMDTGTAATMTLNVYGSTTNDSTISKWATLDTVVISNANFDATAYAHVYDIETKGLAPYMKIGLNPSADIGAKDVSIAIFNA